MTLPRLALLAALAPLAACVAVQTPDAAPFRIDYGTVESVEAVPQPSNVPGGAVVGGVLGLLLSGPSAAEKLVGVAVGATAGGVVGAAADEANANAARAYVVRFADGRAQRIYAEPLALRPGDCVAVESGRYVNVRRVSPAYCQPGPLPAPSPAMSEDEARQCAAAKDELVHAQGREAVDLATRKVRLLCE